MITFSKHTERGRDDFNSFALTKTDVQVNVTLFKTSISINQWRLIVSVVQVSVELQDDDDDDDGFGLVNGKDCRRGFEDTGNAARDSHQHQSALSAALFSNCSWSHKTEPSHKITVTTDQKNTT